MPDITLFGLDIAQIAQDSLTGQLVDLTLTQVANVIDPTDGSVSATATEYSCEGISSTKVERWMQLGGAGSSVQEGDRKVLILAESIKDSAGAVADIVPEAGWTITDDSGETLTILELTSRDPAAATYVLRCR